jgi:hypothetical protein
VGRDSFQPVAVDCLPPELAVDLHRTRACAAAVAAKGQHARAHEPGGEAHARPSTDPLDLGRQEVAGTKPLEAAAVAALAGDSRCHRDADPRDAPSESSPIVVPLTRDSESSTVAEWVPPPGCDASASMRPSLAVASATVAVGGVASVAGTTIRAGSPPWPVAVPASGGGAGPAPERFAPVDIPVLVLAGGESPAYQQNAVAALCAVLPDARPSVVPGQRHQASDSESAISALRAGSSSALATSGSGSHSPT